MAEKKAGKKLSAQQESKGMRIAKYIAHSGYCSRREAESLIEEGAVKVNGQVIDNPATLITDQSVKINNKLIALEQEVRVWIIHKPQGVITSSKDEKNRPTIFELLPKEMPRTISVGRLDFNTEGLLVLTTNGDFARHLELPKNKFMRKYRVRVFGKIDEERLKKLKNGIRIDGVQYGKIEVECDKNKEGMNSWLTIGIEEGKNREIRKVMEYFGLQVNRLIRTNFGPFALGTIKPRQIQEIPRKLLQKHFGQDFRF